MVKIQVEKKKKINVMYQDFSKSKKVSFLDNRLLKKMTSCQTFHRLYNKVTTDELIK